jgi:hypothetical protein
MTFGVVVRSASISNLDVFVPERYMMLTSGSHALHPFGSTYGSVTSFPHPGCAPSEKERSSHSHRRL